MLKAISICLVTVVLPAGLLFAHGNATHIMGTVAAIEGNHVTVKTQDGKSEMVMLEKSTKYLIGAKAGKATDLKTGLRVVIDAKMDPKMKMYSALEVRIGVAASAAEGKAKGAAPAEKHQVHK